MINFFRSFPVVDYIYTNTGNSVLSVDINRNVKAYLNEIDDANAYLYYNITTGSRPDQVSMKLYNSPIYYWTFFVINDHLFNGMHGWPKSSYELNEYITEKYSSKAITGYSKEGVNDEGHLLYLKSFEIGETVEGLTSHATGVILSIDYPMNRLLLTDVVGTFIDEDIEGQSSNAIMPSDIKYYVTIEDEANAPHHYENSTGAQVQNLTFNIGSDLTEVSNYEYENIVNDDKMQIRVLNASMINEFATQYKKLING